MSSNKQIEPTPYARQKYNATTLVDFDAGIKYSSILLAIVGADGELAEAELQWYLDEVKLLGCGQDYIDAIRNIDWKQVNIEAALNEVKFDFSLNISRSLLYQAVKMSRADGVYHEKEKEAVAKAAQVLGVDKTVVDSIESIAEMEDSTSQLLRFILTSDV
ncbi:MAG: hypothetical protein F6K62_16165 [Sphaerospermopsis sp. SIO1G2]|nr:hypothetical protein [Sphaerospermopsis sp. SIO1G1]NET72406.1 hypothetical protein [Sphaerospermopsis sp. SIO1G2]